MEPTLFVYPATLRKGRDGRHTVTFSDLPEALTDGSTEEEALENAADALSEALMGRIADSEQIPAPSMAVRGQYQVAPDPTIAAKVALHRIAREKGVTAAQLARQMQMDHKEARRMLDVEHRTKLPRLAEALSAMGYEVAITVYDASKRERLLSSPKAPRRTTIKPKKTARVIAKT